MDFFDAFPYFRMVDDPALSERALRLLTLSALPYDADAYYFELGQEKYWARGAEGQLLIGVGALQVQLERPGVAPLKLLLRQLRDSWRSEAQLEPQPHFTIIEGDRLAVLSADGVQIPQLLLLTPPRLGGAETPDALVQAIYFLRLRQRPRPVGGAGILRIERTALPAFFAREVWPLVELRAQSWAEHLPHATLPPQAAVRPVLAVRALQRLVNA